MSLSADRHDFLVQLIFSKDRRLLPHQIEQAIFAVECARSLNASETGTGKFLVALAARRLIEHEIGHTIKCLYTCPKSALGQFEQEFIDHGYATFVLRHGKDSIATKADTILVANSTMVPIATSYVAGIPYWQCSMKPLPSRLRMRHAPNLSTAMLSTALAELSMKYLSCWRCPAHWRLVTMASFTPICVHWLRQPSTTSMADLCHDTSSKKSFCVFETRPVANGREIQVIVGSRNSALLRKRIDPFVIRATLREIAPTLPPERHEVVPIAREDVKLDELAAIADLEDEEIKATIEMLTKAIRDNLLPKPDIDREMERLMEMIGGGTALAHLRRAYGLAKLSYVEDIIMSRRNDSKGTPTLIFNAYRMTGDCLEEMLREQGVVVGRIHGDTMGTACRGAAAGAGLSGVAAVPRGRRPHAAGTAYFFHRKSAGDRQ
jgi:hypothetical protein